ncbi:hypothetical protein [Actinomadura flavalba]|uniref:hypothetical protein n=1 Tax=Actinomadura flavalba TaxID=1120938 RepID=UPI000373764E|nr:hypothetical protein [Actinomadura flavalba]
MDDVKRSGRIVAVMAGLGVLGLPGPVADADDRRTGISGLTRLGARECAAVERGEGVRLGKGCVFGVEMTLGEPRRLEGPQAERAVGAAAWKIRDVRASACFSSGRPVMGGGSGWKCKVAKATVSGAFKYNGRRIWATWASCAKRDTTLSSAEITWCGSWNNGVAANDPPGYMNIGLNGTARYFKATSYDFYIRIDGRPSGAVSLRGGGH